MKKIFYIILFLIIFSSIGFAEDLYVRPGTDIDGNSQTYGDGSGSSYANAFEGFTSISWGSGAGNLGPGDTLYVLGGNETDSDAPFYERFLIKDHQGTSASHITIRFKDGINPDGVIWGIVKLTDSWTLDSGDTWYIDMAEPYSLWAIDDSADFADSDYFDYNGRTGESAPFGSLKYDTASPAAPAACKWGYSGGRLYYNDDGATGNCLDADGSTDFYYVPYLLSIQPFLIDGTNRMVGSKYIDVYDAEVKYGEQVGIFITKNATNITTYNEKVTYSGTFNEERSTTYVRGTGIQDYGKDNTHYNTEAAYIGDCGIGIELLATVSVNVPENVSFIDSWLHNNDDAGVCHLEYRHGDEGDTEHMINILYKGMLIEYNGDFNDEGNSGIVMRNSDVVIEDSIIRYNRGPGIYISEQTAGDNDNKNVTTIIRNNLIYDNNYSADDDWNEGGIYLYGDQMGTGNTVYIDQNTILSTSGGNQNHGIRVGVAADTDDFDLYIRNNIFRNNTYQYRRDWQAGTWKPQSIANNLYWDNDSSPTNKINTTNYSDFSEGQAWDNITYTSNDTSGDPLFVDTSNLNFQLQSGSPAKDTGATYSYHSDEDYISLSGATVMQGSAWDIGAFERQSTETFWALANYSTGINIGTSYNGAWRSPDNILWGSDAGQLGAGDTLYLCGSYTEEILIGGSGSSGSPIIIRGDCSSVDSDYTDGTIGARTGADMIADGNMSVGTGRSILFNDMSYVTLQNLSFTAGLGTSFHKNVWDGACTGTHDGTLGWCSGTNGTDDTKLCDNSVSSPFGDITNPDGFVPSYLFNTHDRSWCQVTANDDHIVECTLQDAWDSADCIGSNNPYDCCSGSGTGDCDNYWDDGEGYAIIRDNGLIKIYGTSNNLIIRESDFDLTTNYGWGVELQATTGEAIHDITVQDNTIDGDNDAFMMWQDDVATGDIYSINLTGNTVTDSFRFLDPISSEDLDPDCSGTCDGNDHNDHFPYDIHVDDNDITMASTGDSYAIKFHGLHKVTGTEKNTIQGNRIIGTRAGNAWDATNRLQLHFVKDLLIADNVIGNLNNGTTSTGDGSLIILDWGFTHDQYFISGDIDNTTGDDIIITRNILYGAITDGSTGNYGKAISVYRARNVLIHENVLYDDAMGIIIQGQNLANYVTENINILNNTMSGLRTDDDCFGNNPACGDGLYIANNTGIASIVFKNNIINDATDEGYQEDLTTSALTEDYNLINDADGDNCYKAEGPSTTCGSNDIEDQDPLFLNSTSYNFRLMSESPAIGAAVLHEWMVAGWKDIDGLTRLRGDGPEIGAYEYPTKTWIPFFECIALKNQPVYAGWYTP